MIPLVLEDLEFFDNKREEFIYVKGGTVLLEHSLLSVHKWESKWKKPFMTDGVKSREESIDYIRCMVVSGYADDYAFNFVSDKDMDRINAYIEDPMTATRFQKKNENKSVSSKREIKTAEVIYWQMITLGIPLEFESRHLNMLLALIKTCDIKNTPPKKMSKEEATRYHKDLNARNREFFNSKG